MYFRKLKSMIKQGFQSMWRNRGMGLASVSSIAAVLIILGIVLLLVLSVNSLVEDTQNKLDELDIFLIDDISEEQKELILETINEQAGIKTITFKSKEDALSHLKEEWAEDAVLLEGLEEDNPLPESYVVKVDDLEYVDGVVKAVENLEGVVKVNYHEEAIENLITFANYIRNGGLVIVAILIGVSIFIISNTIKLTVNSRRREISIMKYVGATNGYIKGPFVIEGVIFGLIGALVAILVINYGYSYIFDIINVQLFDFLNVMLVEPVNIFNDIVIIFLAIGSGIGAVGSLISMKRFLNV